MSLTVPSDVSTLEHMFVLGAVDCAMPPAGPDDVNATLGQLSDQALEAEFEAAHRAWLAAGARRLRLLGEIERRRAYRRDGFTSAHTWMAHRLGEAAGTARRDVHIAEALTHMPILRDAMAAGRVPMATVSALVEAGAEHPDAFARAEGALVDAAITATADEMRRVVEEWSVSVDESEGTDRMERLRERRYLQIGHMPNAMVRIVGQMDPESGEVVRDALAAIVDRSIRRGAPDGRTNGQRWADALTEMCERRPGLGSGPEGWSVGERPHVTVTVAAQVLATGSGTGRMGHGGVIPAATARGLACDASVVRVVLGPRSEALDVGRRTPVVRPAIRAAVVARDGSCRFPGCDRPSGWCDAHHVRHWASGGRTAVDNLVLLCREHHRMIHAGGFAVELIEQRPVFRRRDGSVLEGARAP